MPNWNVFVEPKSIPVLWILMATWYTLWLPSFGSFSTGPPPPKSLPKPLKKLQKRPMHKMAPQGPGAKTSIQLNHTFAEYSLSTSHAPSLSPSFLFSFIKIPGQVNFKKDKFQKVAMKDQLPTRTPSNPPYSLS